MSSEVDKTSLAVRRVDCKLAVGSDFSTGYAVLLSYPAMKTIEIEVTLFDKVKVYEVNPVELTGVEDEGYAVMITRQAFISAGMPLARENWLKDNPKPEGVKLTEHYKSGTEESVLDSHFASAEEILAEAKVKAVKALNREGGQNAALAATARLLGMTVEELLALKK